MIAAAPPPTAPSVGQRLAQAGEKAMFDPGLQYGKDQVDIGVTYNNSLLQQSIDATELSLAKAAQQACDTCPHWRGQLAALDAAFTAVASGCAGVPLGATLAAAGRSGMFSNIVQYGTDQVYLGEAFAEAIRDNTTDATQKQLAATALQACDNVATWRAQVDLLQNLFNEIAK
ncbi:MAG: hypothetical protein ACYCW6_28085 [Candidatus Xenobia bacterium]